LGLDLDKMNLDDKDVENNEEAKTDSSDMGISSSTFK